MLTKLPLRKRNCMREFRQVRERKRERESAWHTWGRRTRPRIWRRFVCWTIILWYRLFHLRWTYWVQDFWQQLLGKVGISKMGGKWSFKGKAWPQSTLKCGPKLCTFLQSLFPQPSRQTLKTILNTIRFRTVINAYVLSILKHTLQIEFDRQGICCIRFDGMSESSCISVRSLAVMRSFRVLENMTGQALLQIMPWISWALSCLLQKKCKPLLGKKYTLLFYFRFWNEHKYVGDDGLK